VAEISFAVRVSNSGPLTSDRHLNRGAMEAEQMGFDSISLHDHVVWNNDIGRRRISSGAHEPLCDGQSADFFESLTTIGYLAAKTSTAQPATLDHLSGGRLIAGVGLGSRASKEPSEFDEAMRAIWTQPLASHTGDHISFKDGDPSKATPAAGTGALGRRVDGRRPAYRQGGDECLAGCRRPKWPVVQRLCGRRQSSMTRSRMAPPSRSRS
jgi:alkanesulfonate monooxygenase SsuD/methylene tetrahydromethanopterin reductase-like flavin-dependent oxidoreductase (luciferase family)